MKSSYVLIKMIADQLGFSCDSHNLTGRSNNIEVYITDLSKRHYLNIHLSLCKDGDANYMDDVMKIVQQIPDIHRYAVTGYAVDIPLKITAYKDTAAATAAIVQKLTALLSDNGYHSCCEICETDAHLHHHYFRQRQLLLCDKCSSQANNYLAIETHKHTEHQENIIFGIVGALLGCMLGSIIYLFIPETSVMYFMAGLIVGGLAVLGYRWFAGKPHLAGTIAIGIVVLYMLYLGAKLSWAASIAYYFDTNIGNAYRNIEYLISEGYIEYSDYVLNVVEMVIFGAIGAVVAAICINNISREKTGLMMAIVGKPPVSPEPQSNEEVKQ